jgi:hypothetical protein
MNDQTDEGLVQQILCGFTGTHKTVYIDDELPCEGVIDFRNFFFTEHFLVSLARSPNRLTIVWIATGEHRLQSITIKKGVAP